MAVFHWSTALGPPQAASTWLTFNPTPQQQPNANARSPVARIRKNVPSRRRHHVTHLTLRWELDEAFEPSRTTSLPSLAPLLLRLAFNSLKNMAARRLVQQRALAKLAPHLLLQLSSIDSLLEQCIIGNKTRDARPAELEPLSAVVLRSSSRAAVFMFRHRRRRLCVFY